MLLIGRGGEYLYAADIARELGISPSKVHYHISKLVEKYYLEAVDGKHNPQKYAKGADANLLDAAIQKLNIQIYGGTVNPPQNSNSRPTSPSTPLSTDVPTDRAHINGRISFPVLKVGQFKELALDPNGTKAVLPLFADPPYNTRGKVYRYLAKVPYDGEDVTVEFAEAMTTGTLLLHVWPPAKRLTARELKGVEQVFMGRAQDIADFLSKKGGWVFDAAMARFELHHGLQDTPVAKDIPEVKRRLQAGGMYTDHSPGNGGEQELETKDVEKALISMTYPERVQTLEGGQKAIIREIVEHRMTIEQLREFVRSLTEYERERAELETLRAKAKTEELAKAMHESAAATANGNGAGESGSSFSQDKYEVMYQ